MPVEGHVAMAERSAVSLPVVVVAEGRAMAPIFEFRV